MMGKMRSMGEKGPENTVIGYRAAREVARGLRARGWAVTGVLCRGQTPKQIARKAVLEGDEAAARRLAGEIAVLMGLVPSVEVG